MIVMTLAGTVGVYLVNPFWGVAVYYLFAVLRPQYMWEWSLPKDVSWSFYVAVATIGAALASAFGVRFGPAAEASEGHSAPRLSLAHYAVLLFGLWIGVTYVTAQSQNAAYMWLIEYIKIFIMFAVAAVLTRTVRQVWSLFLLTALALAYISYEVNYLYFVSNYLGIYKNGYGGLDNNGAALMLAMGVPLCWFIYEAMTTWWRWVFVALIPVIIHAVLMTYSRGAMVSLLGLGPLLVVRSRQRVRLGIAGTILAVSVVPILAGSEIRARFLTLENTEVDDSANSRRESWKAALKIAVNYPVFGVGIRNANLFSHQYGADMEGRTIHSNYLQIAADNGFPGLALFLTALAACWFSLRRVRRFAARRNDLEGRRIYSIACGVECSMLVFCIGSVFLSLEVVELPYLLLFLAAQLAVVSGAADKRLASDHSVSAPSAGRRPFIPEQVGSSYEHAEYARY
ncbi:MAG TPA: O-antigen ligase family protein [Gemmataceae bacterium]|nr:O-antigen ligase family protein [Gemmataceae bacterium]